MASSQLNDLQRSPSGSSSSSVGRSLIANKYVIIKPHIGEGSFAKVQLDIKQLFVELRIHADYNAEASFIQVYRGKNQETDEVVAIKEISWLVIRRRSPEFIARHSQNLRNETDILQSLDHPNIVRLLGENYSTLHDALTGQLTFIRRRS